MPDYSVQITIFPVSNVVEDATVGNWSINATTVGEAVLATDEIVNFYDSLRTYAGNLVRQNNHSYKIFDRADPTPRQPVAEGLWNYTSAPSGNPLPPEVAKCISFQGAPQSGVPQARRRGRIFLGPFGNSILSTTGRPTTTFVDAVRDAGQVLLDASDAAPDWSWQVYSEANGTGVNVLNGWVDDEFDTIRSRGRVATFRDVFS